MEEDLKILKVEYLGLDDQTIFYKFLKLRQPPMEDELRCKDKFSMCRM